MNARPQQSSQSHPLDTNLDTERGSGVCTDFLSSYQTLARKYTGRITQQYQLEEPTDDAMSYSGWGLVMSAEQEGRPLTDDELESLNGEERAMYGLFCAAQCEDYNEDFTI